MRTAELRMKEETAVAEKRGRGEEQRNTVKSFVTFFKRTQPEMSEAEVYSAIKDSVDSDFSLSDGEIREIIHQNLK
ncbi:hypothetical protein [Lactobacillus psittaci]|uniref:Uncharacterized protein n=1 Tax=Lactobacillus psittaci DSM 15354 TaxID=1122152 RepID=A0A0R1RYF5_9LACO|nr:hypothetical protein [Lactobacillus psittaci]KRL62015.1 hypothetical protein FC23_GL000391 [Lactobacillus psittaci DSM 15354]